MADILPFERFWSHLPDFTAAANRSQELEACPAGHHRLWPWVVPGFPVFDSSDRAGCRFFCSCAGRKVMTDKINRMYDLLQKFFLQKRIPAWQFA